ncbi:SMP-30/gluconolactonase/LRE family protein [Microbacterium sp. YY-01]|uniref:SMP-30/gluconolactonase/LRE family protein n=1 Tax=Microbacterium sp. YY-01 TaxID=3421634 RepID=UPI003D1667A2
MASGYGLTESFSSLVAPGERVTRLTTAATWSEGPVWIPERRAVRWSDIPGNRIMEYAVETGETSVYKEGAEFTNGRTLDHDGSVIQCSHGRRRIERDRDGEVTPIVDSWNGVRFNSPNDVIVASDGTIWFTDPPYGITVPVEGYPGEREYRDHYVFRHDPETGVTMPVVLDVEEPNGLAFSPDEKTLYVSDTSLASLGETGNHHIRAYDVDDNRVKNGRVFATIERGIADGFRVDIEGNIWTSSLDAVLVYTPAGELIGRIPVPEKVGNVCFGGDDGTELFIAASTSIYHLKTLTRCAERGQAR